MNEITVIAIMPEASAERVAAILAAVTSSLVMLAGCAVVPRDARELARTTKGEIEVVVIATYDVAGTDETVSALAERAGEVLARHLRRLGASDVRTRVLVPRRVAPDESPRAA